MVTGTQRGEKEVLESLKVVLDQFNEKYEDKLGIGEGILDLNGCFIKERTGKYQAPAAFGNLNRNRALCYVVYGEPFITKYKRKQNGKLVYKNGSFIIKEKTADFKVLTCLCNKRMKNMSLHEVYDAISNSPRATEIQGFKDWNLRNVISLIEDNYPEFNINEDTAFIFSDKKQRLIPKIKLNKLWLNQITHRGAGALETTTKRETELIKKVFKEEDFSAPKKLGYEYGEKHYVPESSLFMKKKLDNVS